jgi:sulfonate transport system substrate-binding protein
MGEGKIDIGYAGIVPPLFAQADGVPFVYVGNEAVSAKTIGILVPQDSAIQTLADLKGKKITSAQKSVGYYFLIQALLKAGLKLEDAEFVPLPPTEGIKAFQKGEVDAWIGWNPFLAQAQETIPVRLLANGEGLVNDRNFYLATKSFVEDRSEIVKIVIEEMRQAGVWASHQPEAAAEILAKKMGLKPSTALNVIKVHAFEAQPIQDGAIEEQQRVADTFFRLGLLPTQIRVEDVVWKGKLTK